MSRSDDRTDVPAGPRDFIRQIIADDLDAGRTEGRIVTRFPPEPNGYLHIGHAKSVVLNFGIAGEHEGGRCHLRFDDTNPTTEDLRFVSAIQEDIRWLGFDWGEHLYFASDYFEEMYSLAEELIRKGLAYVDSQSEEEIREGRGTVSRGGSESLFRSRSVEENLDLFRRMREGEFPDGTHVLRAKIDMASPNMLMRDPVLYRIRHASHYRTGDRWCLYPLYDFAHPIEDALECVTHSLCTLEFANNRELYDWVVEHTTVPCRPRQYEFARLNLEYTVMSKRKLGRLVREGAVGGWDDPRMPTLAGLRRRGVTPDAIRSFCEMIGVAKADSRVDMGKLEYAIRDDLNPTAPRVLCVADPLRVVVTSWGEDEEDWIDAPYFPRDVPREATRKIPFSRTLLIDRDDFREDPPSGFRRLVPGGEVRLRYGYIIRCEEVVKDQRGHVVELRCTHDPASRGGSAPDGRKVKGTIQWVSASHAVPCELRLYDRLFRVPDPEAPREEGEGFRDFLNPGSLVVLANARVEPSVLEDPPDTRYQFERLGYFWRDPADSTPERPVFNRIVTLRDRWARKEEAGRAPAEAVPTLEEPGKADGPAAAGSPPEVPRAVRERADALAAEYGVGAVEAEILARSSEVERFFRATVAARPGSRSAVAAANWIIHELPPVRDDRKIGELPFGPEGLAELIGLVEEGVVSSRGAKEVLAVLAAEGGDPRELVGTMNLEQVSDEETVGRVLEEVLEAHPAKVEEYQGGRTGLLGFFMGRVMALTEGKADPELAKRLLRERLG